MFISFGEDPWCFAYRALKLTSRVSKFFTL
jgi:hypothetical protein